MNIFKRLLGWLLVALGAAATPAWAQLVPNWAAVGPAGGGVTTLLSDPVASSTLYAGSDSNGVYVSTDLGATWAMANAGIPTQASRHVYALASMGNFVYAAMEGGVYVSPAGAVPRWSALTIAPSACDFTLLARVGDSLLAAAPCGAQVWSTKTAGPGPVWKTLSVPGGGSVAALGQINGALAVGTTSAVYLTDASTGSLVSSESALEQGVLASPVVAIASGVGPWAFVCTQDGTVYQGDVSVGNTVVNWLPLTFASADVPTSCNALALVKVGSAPSLWVLTLATDSGGFISSAFDEQASALPNLLPGPAFPMTSHVNTALPVSVAGSDLLLWATEYGVYSNILSDVAKWLNPITATPRNGAATVQSPSQRLDNVNVSDVALLGANWYAVAESVGRPSYGDVLKSSDGGATWQPTGLTSDYYFSTSIGRVRVLAADATHKVLYAATNAGVFALRESDRTWNAVGNFFDVKALAVGAQAVYAGRDATTLDEAGTIHRLSGGGLVVLSLLDQPAFSIDAELMPSLPPDFSVRALAVDGKSVYAAGGILRSADVSYENMVYVANDVVAGSAPALWSRVGSTAFSAQSAPILGHMTANAGQVFAGGDGFLRQCLTAGAPWTDVPGLPLLSNGDGQSVSGVASDGVMLYVGINGGGLWSWKIGSTFPMKAIDANSAGTSLIPTQLVNGVRYLGGQIFVATAAGVLVGTPLAATPSTPTVSSGGGCSIASSNSGLVDPTLWLMVLLSGWLAWRRYRPQRLREPRQEELA
ncbi:MAG: JDVT-CTERM domain-containing protein [Burkholderiales bacterium]|nr:JDVT-CTERM domain-containing protein [Burkholderiales bacterium]